MTRRYYSCYDIYPQRNRDGDIGDDEVGTLGGALAEAVEQNMTIMTRVAADHGEEGPLTLVETRTTPLYDGGKLLLILVETVMEGTTGTGQESPDARGEETVNGD